MAFSAFLQIEGIEGECTDADHDTWIEILSYSHNVSQPGTGSGSSGGALSAERADHSPFSIVKALDKTSPNLAHACSSGKMIPTINIEICRTIEGKQVKYMEYKFENCMIGSFSPGGSAQGAESLPLEEVTWAYQKITWNYIVTNHDTGAEEGNVENYWNTKDNSGG